MSHHHSYKSEIKKFTDTGEVEIKSSISAEEFGEHVRDVLKDYSKEITLHGFRKGSAPERLVREKIGESALLSEAAENAISHAYGHIIDMEKIDAVGRPQVSITKIAEGNPLEFTLRTAVIPEIASFDYAKIAKSENAKKGEVIIVSDEDVEKALENIRKGRSVGESKEVKLPELTDEFAKSLGEFKDVADLKSKIKENLTHEKEHRAKEKKRLALIDEIADKVSAVIPRVMVESELDRMVGQMRHDIERMGLSFDEYLKHLKKSEADMRKEWGKDAEKKVKLDLALDHIAKTEKIVANKKKVDAEIEHIVKDHKDIDIERARMYFKHAFQTQAVFDYLESVK
jgi:FKBP-type peptidyl-prolyl cis-trans isomerase (trigger factor)